MSFPPHMPMMPPMPFFPSMMIPPPNVNLRFIFRNQKRFVLF